MSINSLTDSLKGVGLPRDVAETRNITQRDCGSLERGQTSGNVGVANERFKAVFPIRTIATDYGLTV